MTAISLPAFSGRLANCTAAWCAACRRQRTRDGCIGSTTRTAVAAPLEMPTKRPSLVARFLATSMAVSLLIVIISSMTLMSRMPGTKPAASKRQAVQGLRARADDAPPMPWILWGPGLPPLSTGLSAGSTATILMAGFLDLR